MTFEGVASAAATAVGVVASAAVDDGDVLSVTWGVD